MEIIINDKLANNISIDNFLLTNIKEIIINNDVNITQLGNYINKFSKENKIKVTKYGKHRKLNTYLKEQYGGLRKFLENQQIFKINDDKISIINEEDFILI